MKEHSKEYSIEKMAQVLGVSKSGYYSWLKRPESKRSLENKKLLEDIKKIHEESRRTYGSPRVHKALLKKGLKCSIKRVARLMCENNIRSKVRKKFKATTNSKHSNPVAPNLLDRNFIVQAPDKVWVSDITYIYTNEGWLYLCIIVDLYSRKVIGWSMGCRIDTKLVKRSFLMALINRNYPKGVLFHSDRGVQYTSKAFQSVLEKSKYVCSMSRKGNCWDNACAESFFHTLKTEEVYHKKYKTRIEAKRSIFEYIEVFYNRKRIHSFLGDMSPEEYEIKHRA
jgi:transposase InsO family protein